MMENEPTLEQMLTEFPAYLVKVLLGLCKAVLTEPDATLVLTFGVVVGCLTTPLTGVAVGLGLYLVFRMVSQATSSVSRNLAFLATVIRDRE